MVALAWLTSLYGCLLPLDILGVETIVTEHETHTKDLNIEDDRIEDKRPIYDPDLITAEVIDGCEVILNKSGSVTKLDILPFAEEEEFLAGRLYPGRGAALEQITQRLPSADVIPSLEVVNGHLKPFNDGLYAAIEIGMQEGTSQAPANKRQLLVDLLSALEARLATATPAQQGHLENAMVFIAAGLLAGGYPTSLRADLQARAQSRADQFLLDGMKARPIGFYTWNAALKEVFRQDRFLQNLEGQGPDMPDQQELGWFAAIAVVLEEEPALLEEYQEVLALYTGLTNPYASYTPIDLLPYVAGLASLDNVASLRSQFLSDNPVPFACTKAYLALLPSSGSKDTEYFNSRWCSSPPPPGTSFIDELILAIRGNELDLTPEPDSGWYDYQLWALETLLLPERGPESDHLLLTAAYKKKLIETFKSIITQNRETHVKQLQTSWAVSGLPLEIEVYPLFQVEPFPTFYLRTARGYRFLSTYLLAVLGGGFMGQASRLHEDGTTSAMSLGEELGNMTELLYGLYLVSAHSVGLRPESYLLTDELSEIDTIAAVTRAKTWLAEWRTDPDVLKDPRVIVPVGTDASTGTAIYWAVIGVKAFKALAEFVPGYEPKILEVPFDPETMFGYEPELEYAYPFCKVTGFAEHHYLLLMEQMVEVHLRRAADPPTRDELRAICDRYGNAADIVAALEAL